MTDACLTAADRLAADPVGFVPADEVEFALALANPMYRLNNLYFITVKEESDDEDAPGLVMKFKMNKAQTKLAKRLWYRNIIPKARQLGFCVDPNTRVLTADLEWIPIKDLRIGQEIVAVDEHVPGGRGKGRKMRTAKVQAVGEVHRKAFRITFDDGRQVVCTDQHPWLSRKVATDCKWRSLSGTGNQVVGKLKVGTQVRWIAKPWGPSDYEDGYMGGMLDGEGSMCLPASSGAEVNVSQVVGPALARMEMYLDRRGYSYRTEVDSREGGVNSKLGKIPVHKLVVSRMDEMFRLLGQTRPIRFIGRKFWEGKDLPGQRTGIGWATITKIEELGEQTMIDLQTSTGTYIAEGFVSHNTTFACILALDYAMFTANFQAGIIAHTDGTAKKLFRDKVLFAYDMLPEEIRAAMPLRKQSAEELVFDNGSSILVSTSMRGGTMHFLHISEFGKICARFPHRAREIVTGSLPAVPKTGIVIVESTAEGRDGDFYSMTMRAKAHDDAGKTLTIKDYRLHFFPWYAGPDYQMEPEGVIITDADHDYFDELEAKLGIRLNIRQRAWYCATRDEDFSGDQQKMWQEYPSTVDECFMVSSEGCYFTKQITAARKQNRILEHLPTIESTPCWTFWDIGNSDGTAVWVIQKIGQEFRAIRFYEAWGEPYADAVQWLQSLGLAWDTMYLPHDADHVRQGQTSNKSPKDMLEELMPGVRFEIVPRIEDINWGIQQTRDVFPMLWFDETECKPGIIHLESYRKKWNQNQERWSDQPDKAGGHSEAADALRMFAQAYTAGLMNLYKPPPRKRRTGSWRTA